MITSPDLMYDLMRSRQGVPLLGVDISRFDDSKWSKAWADRPLAHEEATILARFAARLQAARNTFVGSEVYQALTTGTFAIL
jgi:hypothetical protein